VLEVSKSGYYAWVSRPESERKKQQRVLDVLVKTAFEARHARYGSEKIRRELLAQGNPYSRSRVADSMRRKGLRSKVRQKFVVTTESKHNLKASPNPASSRWILQTRCGPAISLIYALVRDGCIWSFSSTCSPAVLSAGVSAPRWDTKRC
jgi:hypothetical protein